MSFKEPVQCTKVFRRPNSGGYGFVGSGDSENNSRSGDRMEKGVSFPNRLEDIIHGEIDKDDSAILTRKDDGSDCGYDVMRYSGKKLVMSHENSVKSLKRTHVSNGTPSTKTNYNDGEIDDDEESYGSCFSDEDELSVDETLGDDSVVLVTDDEDDDDEDHVDIDISNTATAVDDLMLANNRNKKESSLSSTFNWFERLKKVDNLRHVVAVPFRSNRHSSSNTNNNSTTGATPAAALLNDDEHDNKVQQHRRQGRRSSSKFKRLSRRKSSSSVLSTTMEALNLEFTNPATKRDGGRGRAEQHSHQQQHQSLKKSIKTRMRLLRSSQQHETELKGNGDDSPSDSSDDDGLNLWPSASASFDDDDDNNNTNSSDLNARNFWDSSSGSSAGTSSFEHDTHLPFEGYMPVLFAINHNKNADGLPLKRSRCSGNSEDGEEPSLPPPPPTPAFSNYFDTVLNEKISPLMRTQFAAQNRIFVRAIIDLLAERDLNGVVANINDPYTIKAGTLKKSSMHLGGRATGQWKYKYLELRKGLLSYYSDRHFESSKGGGGEAITGNIASAVTTGQAMPTTNNTTTGSLKRKNLVLRTGHCSCQPLLKSSATMEKKYYLGAVGSNSANLIFELSVGDGPRQLFLTNSTEELNSWISAIHWATVGSKNNNGSSGAVADEFLGRDHAAMDYVFSPHDYAEKRKYDISRYLKSQAALKNALSKEKYLSAISPLWGTRITLPTQFLRDQTKTYAGSGAAGLSSRLWRDMLGGVFSINGHELKGDGAYGPERIIGALVRCILDMDRAAALPSKITELQAISYARNIILSGNIKTISRISYQCVDSLCSNNQNAKKKKVLVVLCPHSSQTELLKIYASPVVDTHTINQICSREQNTSREKSGWLTTRSSAKMAWRNYFCVLSDDIFTYYEKEYPTPHGLKGQLVLTGASMATSEVKSLNSNINSSGNDFFENQNVARKELDLGTIFRKSGNGSGNNKKDLFSSHDNIVPPLSMRQQQQSFYLLCIVTKDKERQFCFDDRNDYLDWFRVLERHVESHTGVISRSNSYDDITLPSQQPQEGAPVSETEVHQEDGSENSEEKQQHPQGSATENGMNAPNTSNNNKQRKTFLPSPSEIMRNFNRHNHARGAGVDDDPFERGYIHSSSANGGRRSRSMDGILKTAMISSGGSNNSTNNAKWSTASLVDKVMLVPSPSIKVTLEHETLYKVCTADPEGEDSKDTWAMIRTKWIRSSYLSGGIYGRNFGASEGIEMGFLEGSCDKEVFDLQFGTSTA